MGVLSYLQNNQHHIMGDIERLVKAESPSNDKQYVDQCGDVLCDLFRERLGLEAEVIQQTKVGNHLKFTYGTGNAQILLLTHYDTVWDAGVKSYYIEGNKAFGPGVFDMKGGIIQAIWAVKACKDLEIDINRKIVFLCTSDEEIGSPTSRKWIEQEGLRSEAVFVTESAVAGTGALKTSRKGQGQFTIKIEGKAAHSGNHHEDGASAVEEMARQIQYIHAQTDYAKGTTLNVGIAKGGTRFNVVAEQAQIEVDLRMSTKEEGERIAALIRNVKPSLPGTTLHVSGGITRPTMEKNIYTDRLFQLASECWEQLRMANLAEESVGGGSDGNFTAALGIPTLDGLGVVGEGAHAENEHILIDQVPLRIALLSKLLERYCREVKYLERIT